jgi:uncharacterized protein (TIGR02145 family)
MNIFTTRERAILSVAAAITAACLFGCGGNPAELAGRWVYISGSGQSRADDLGSMVLFKNGAGVVDGSDISWKVEKKRLIIKSPDSVFAGEFSVTGSILTLTLGDGGSEAFVNAGGGNKPPELVGHWLYVSGTRGNKPKAIELLTDGTGVCDGENITWKVDDRLYVIELLRAIAADYNISGDMLTLAYGGEDSAAFVTKEKFEEYAFIDGRDGKTYRKAVIGGKVWMAQNLDYQPPAGKSWCYDNDGSNCARYGRLYNWNTAKKACPAGWHLPTGMEWGDMIRAVGGKSEVIETEMDPYVQWSGGAGKKLKSKTGWSDNGNGTDDYGFSALPGGKYRGKFEGAGRDGIWWNASESMEAWRYYQSMSGGDEMGDGYAESADGYSVRCVQDKKK